MLTSDYISIFFKIRNPKYKIPKQSFLNYNYLKNLRSEIDYLIRKKLY